MEADSALLPAGLTPQRRFRTPAPGISPGSGLAGRWLQFALDYQADSSAEFEPLGDGGCGTQRVLVAFLFVLPDITQAILDGRQPHDLTAEKLLAHSRLPLLWHDQRSALGFA